MARTGRPTFDLTGQKFGMLTAIERDYSSDRNDAMWICKCDCGNKKSVSSSDLRHSKVKSCGCSSFQLVSESKLKDISGKRYGRLVAIGRVRLNENHLSVWLCKCDCGNYCEVPLSGLTGGKTRSCGCLHKETFNRNKHKESKTRLYRIWAAMRDRCNRPGSINYKWYGGKGVKVCEEWSNDYESFRDWALANGYEDGLTIDRIDSEKDYCPSNCRWLTRSENARIAAIEMQRRRHSVQKSD